MDGPLVRQEFGSREMAQDQKLDMEFLLPRLVPEIYVTRKCGS